MPNKKISELNEATTPEIELTDAMPIVNGTETKKATVETLMRIFGTKGMTLEQVLLSRDFLSTDRNKILLLADGVVLDCPAGAYMPEHSTVMIVAQGPTAGFKFAPLSETVYPLSQDEVTQGELVQLQAITQEGQTTFGVVSTYLKQVDTNVIKTGLRYLSDQGKGNLRICDYGQPQAVPSGIGEIHLVMSGSGTGQTDIDLSGADIGTKVIISDSDRKSNGNNIVLDAGTGNDISYLLGSPQTITISVNGQTLTLQKVTATRWVITGGV